ncbi:MAG: peptidylprolyl isomerase [Phycisphaerae bacterium]|nr:peptidylprolyl isomerase [Phycisphaerae bacterium]
MTQVKQGDTVKVHYRGTLKDGNEFDCSHGRDPLEFKVAAGQMIPGFDKAVEGMAVGDKKTITIPAAEAYGEKRDELTLEAPRDRFPEDMQLELGMKLQMPQPGGQMVVVTITKIAEEAITLDANHELAGEDLTFEIEMVEIA